jgi:hypothetical protein
MTHNVLDSITFRFVWSQFFFLGFQADEPSEDPSLMEDYARTAIPEEGFKGNSPFICLSHRLFVLTIFVSTRSQEPNSSVAESHPASNRQVPKKNKQTHTQKFSCCDVCLSLITDVSIFSFYSLLLFVKLLLLNWRVNFFFAKEQKSKKFKLITYWVKFNLFRLIVTLCSKK